MRRVVITGIGIISPVGSTIPEFWENIKNGKSGIKEITSFDTTGFKAKFAAEITDFNPEDFMDKKEARKMDRYCQFASAAADNAVADSGIDLSEYDPYMVGCIIGSGIGGMHTLESEHTKLVEKGPGRISPFMIPMLISNMASGTVSMKYGIKGESFSIVTACSSSTHALGEAYRAIKNGYLNACLAGGAEAVVTPLSIAGFSNMKALSNAQSADRASIPFDKERSGFTMGEGAAVLVLETYENAVKRGAKIYAEIAGYGATSDAYHMTSPDPEGKGAENAMLMAVKDAGLDIYDIDYINAHGTGTPMNDKIETLAIKNAFKDHAKDLYVTSTKAVTGHLLGAAGAVEAAVCALSLRDGTVPMTANHKVFDEECDLNILPNKTVNAPIKAAISNSLGFGGHNGSLLLKKV